MKKMDMIKHIQVKEAKLFFLLKQSELIFGQDSLANNRARSTWGSIIELMDELGIEQDHKLPDHDRAYTIMSEILKNKDVAM